MGAFAHLGTDEDILIISRAPPDASKVLCFYFHVGSFNFFIFPSLMRERQRAGMPRGTPASTTRPDVF
jgi:hypothetical protein